MILEHHNDDNEDLFDLREEDNDSKNGYELYEGDCIELHQVGVSGSHLNRRVRSRMLVVGWVKKAKFLIWAFLFAGQLQTGVRNPPPKKFKFIDP